MNQQLAATGAFLVFNLEACVTSLEQLPHIITCPFCWEQLDILVDPSIEQQTYTEDCQVCCHPISLNVIVDLDGDVNIEVERE